MIPRRIACAICYHIPNVGGIIKINDIDRKSKKLITSKLLTFVGVLLVQKYQEIHRKAFDKNHMLIKQQLTLGIRYFKSLKLR